MTVSVFDADVITAGRLVPHILEGNIQIQVLQLHTLDLLCLTDEVFLTILFSVSLKGKC